MHDKAVKDSQSEPIRGWRLDLIRRRLIGDFYLCLLGLFALLAAVILLPFFLYRLMIGDLQATVGNGILLAFPLLAFAYAWFSGRTNGARWATVLFMSAGCVLMVTWVGHSVYWVYPTVVANFMLVNWRSALAINALMTAIVFLAAPSLIDSVDGLSFLAAVLMVALYAMVFVIHTHFHRDQLSVMAETDELTGTLNRRAMVAHLEQALAGSDRFGQTHALAIFDLDDFKRVNDDFGHETGDRVLVDFAHRIMRECRRGDLLYRLGGDEFVLLFTHTDRKGAEIALAKLQGRIRAYSDPVTGPVPVSIGVAIGRADESWSSWLGRADRAMYQVKSEGKNQIRFAEAPPAQG